ncbi:GCN5 family N-acetyltransferase [Pontibacillus halophilus JSM 076056 = DSM 19796]|uniref:GCN5 family N-acetyltransferase n=1 Tax=Pontibacillus halophilus JSM 076056 = DSM 19796 TaxID=1385510 RepID=A0A0A5GJI6_9BACI|nr:GNAT family protein [Pontibacillus halophilus]KGX91378.1 GCN5 family N-acetyltransferase [Pontibacillus halophilus JSM 076056 = DSM 19796]
MNSKTMYPYLPTLETERLRLRKLTLEDVEDIYEYGSNDEVTRYVTWDTHQSLSDSLQFVEFVLQRYEEKEVAPWGIQLKETGKIIGTIDFVSRSPHHRKAEIGYVLSQEHWGKGIVPEAVNELLTFGFTKLDLVRIEARCFIENAKSERVMEKSGMTFEGILRKVMFVKGEHRDLKVYSILKEEFDCNK